MSELNVLRFMGDESIHEVDTDATRADERVDHARERGAYASPMKTTYDIRRGRLRALIDEVAAGNAADFGRQVGKDRRQISAWLREPGKEGAKNISDTSAREIENHFAKGRGWLDGRDREGAVNPWGVIEDTPRPYVQKPSHPVQQEREIVAAAVKLVRYIKERSVAPIPDEMESDLLFHAMRIVRDSGLDGAEGMDEAARQLAASMRNGG